MFEQYVDNDRKFIQYYVKLVKNNNHIQANLSIVNFSVAGLAKIWGVSEQLINDIKKHILSDNDLDKDFKNEILNFKN